MRGYMDRGIHNTGRAHTAACAMPGPSSDAGLHLRSYRVEGGLEATLQLDKKYQAFPGAASGLSIRRWIKRYRAFPGAARSAASAQYDVPGLLRVSWRPCCL